VHGVGQVAGARAQLHVGERQLLAAALQLGGALLDQPLEVDRLAREMAMEKTKAAKPNGMTRRVTIQPRSEKVSFR
jgi:hypothetical protein